MNGKTQFPHSVEFVDGDEVDEEVDGVVDPVEGVVEDAGAPVDDAGAAVTTGTVSEIKSAGLHRRKESQVIGISMF